MVKILSMLWPLIVAIGLSACQLNQIDLPPAPDQPPVYHLDSGDKLALQIFNQPELSGQFEVASDGTLSVPLIGPVTARAHTVQELAEEIRTRLDHEALVNPKVNLEIILYRPIFILGEVNRAGGFPYSPGLRVQQAVALAGGFTRRAITDQLVVTRIDPQGRHRYRIGLDDFIYPDDTIDVQRRLF